jgi:hypothetical protein
MWLCSGEFMWNSSRLALRKAASATSCAVAEQPPTVAFMLSVSCPVCGAVIPRPEDGSANGGVLHITSCRRSPRPPVSWLIPNQP